MRHATPESLTPEGGPGPGCGDIMTLWGILEGERAEHQGNVGEAGMGIRIERGAKHVTISGVTTRKMWGDGIYVEDATDAKFCAVTADSN